MVQEVGEGGMMIPFENFEFLDEDTRFYANRNHLTVLISAEIGDIRMSYLELSQKSNDGRRFIRDAIREKIAREKLNQTASREVVEP